MNDRTDQTPHSWPLVLLRYVLPGSVILGGIVVMALGSEAELEGGAAIVGAGLAIFFLNWLFRAGVAGEREREREDRAREHFDRHGRWPD
ncbi:MAG TPA: hypothetical protein VNV44_05830 [Solirubrobacteraceae bacterium]|jgi:hypothetical protein|nr:hypothetical protein [Solirubrobacteraceae bacterium]